MPQNLRKSMRMPPQEGHERATVRIGRSDWTARVLNESAGGMELVLDGFPEVGVGERIVVKIYSGWYELSVVRVESTDEVTQLGLKRVACLPELESLAFDARNRIKKGSFLGRNAPLSLCAIMLCIGFGVLLPRLITGTYSSVFGQSAPAARKTSIENLNLVTPHGEANKLAYGLSSLSTPSVLASLELSDQQHAELERIYGETSRTLEKLSRNANAMPRNILQRESTKAIERATLRVLRLLTDQQIERWLDSLGESNADGSAEKSNATSA
ncbi:MAG: hypothetical protein KDA42_03985 [Planctomycetales bacterium]|nr:hypothetical protein [Planctomycetales bacterium]